MTYGYIRVSTDKQDTVNQRFEIENFARNHNIIINSWVEETISSRQDLKKRKLAPLLHKMKKGDLMIACELSRLGRNLMQIMSILHGMLEKECQIWTIKDNYRLGNDISSKVLAFAFGLSAEIERNLISQRTKAALDRKRSEGIILGRPMGSTSAKKKLDDKEKLIKGYLAANLGFSAIARLLKCHRLTVSTICRERGWSDKSTLKQPEHLSETIRIRQKYTKHQLNVPDEDLLKKFKECNHSLSKLASFYQVTTSAMKIYLTNTGMYEKLKAASNEQRMLFKSKKQIERDTEIQNTHVT